MILSLCEYNVYIENIRKKGIREIIIIDDYIPNYKIHILHCKTKNKRYNIKKNYKNCLHNCIHISSFLLLPHSKLYLFFSFPSSFHFFTCLLCLLLLILLVLHIKKQKYYKKATSSLHVTFHSFNSKISFTKFGGLAWGSVSGVWLWGLALGSDFDV